MPPLLSSRPIDRRRVLTDAARGAADCALAGLGLAWLAGAARALPEGNFLSACIRCGPCVRACPDGTLSLAEPGTDGAAAGTSFFLARAVPCEMCEDIPCAAACPTGALDPGLTGIDDARMGTAVLVDHENCPNWQGLRCDVCSRVCPAIDKAITLERQHDGRSGHHARFIPTVRADHCTGCGKCERACVLPEAAIKVLPARLARGAPAGHYRNGWEEKDKAGGALVETVDLPDRLPPGAADPVARLHQLRTLHRRLRVRCLPLHPSLRPKGGRHGGPLGQRCHTPAPGGLSYRKDPSCDRFIS